VENEAGDRFVFRLTDALPASAPDGVEAVRGDVESDVIRMKAMEQAAQAAAAALSTDDFAAEAERLGPFQPQQGPTQANVESAGLPAPMSRPATAALTSGIVRLAGEESRSGVIEIPDGGYALATRIIDITPDYTSNAALARLVVTARDRLSSAALGDASIQDDFFDPTSIERRTGFEPNRALQRRRQADAEEE
jgi:hypothetical protein